jgi:hypothetical protein
MTIAFGLVPYPSMVESHLPASNPMVQESGAPEVPEAIFWHRMVGSLLGTDGWFHAGHAATAYGVGVQATDGAQLAGVIYEWIAPRTGWYGESSGPWQQPYGDGLIYGRAVGAGSINRLSKAIEISGDVGTALDEKSRDAIANITAYWADQRHIPYTEFPLLKAANRSFVIWHNEITGMTYKTCPGHVVMNETEALIERTKRRMQQFQEAGAEVKPPKYAPKNPLPGPVVSQVYGGKVFVRATGGLTLAETTAPLQWASPTAKATAPAYAKGRKVAPAYSTLGDDGEVWIVEKNGQRWRFSSFVEGS